MKLQLANKSNQIDEDFIAYVIVGITFISINKLSSLI